jgi:hypothetical protein
MYFWRAVPPSRGRRKPNRHLRPPPRLAIELDRAARTQDQASYAFQAEAAAVARRLGREERFEGASQRLWQHARPVVPHLEHNAVTRWFGERRILLTGLSLL